MDWVAMSAPWLKHESALEAAHKVVLDELIERAKLQPGESVLDIGCGSGSSTMRALDAVGETGKVIAVEIAPPLADRAAARLSGPVQIKTGDAQTYAFAPQSVDVAISLFGSMFFADTVAAFKNIRTVMRPGGRMVLAAWSVPPQNPWFSLGRQVATERLGPGAPPVPNAPGPFAFADADRVLGLLGAAGWQASVQTVDMHLMPRGSAQDIAELQMIIGAASNVMAEKEGNAEDRASIKSTLASRFQDMIKGGQVHVPAQIHFFTALCV